MTPAEIIESNLARGKILIAMNDDALAEVGRHPRRFRHNRRLLRETRARIAEVDAIIRYNDRLMPHV